MPIPPHRSAGDAGHIGDHNDMADQLTTNVAGITANTNSITAHTSGSDPHGDRNYSDTTKLAISLRGTANGVASLDSSTLIPSAQIPNLDASKITTGTLSTSRLPARPIVYATDYGFVANGLTTSAAANSTALTNAFAALNSTYGGTVMLPAGPAYISSTIVLPMRTSLWGMGIYSTLLQLADNSNCPMIANHVSTDGVNDPNAMFCGVYNLALDGRGSHQSNTGTNYYGIYWSVNPLGTIATADPSQDPNQVVSNVHIRNTWNASIHSEGRSDNHIYDCRISSAGGNAIEVAYDTTVVGCTIEKPAQAGVYITGSSTRVIGTKVFATGQSNGSGHTAVPNSGHGYVVTGSGIGEIALVGCDAQQVSGHGFHVTGGASGVTIDGCTVAEASYGNGTSFVAFNADNATNVVVTGASKVDNSFNSVRLVNGADQCDVRVTHSLNTGQTTLASVISSDTVLANSRVRSNGQAISKLIRPWTATTVFTVGSVISYLGCVYQVTTTFTSGSTFSAANLSMLSAPMPGTPIPAGMYAFASGGQNPSTANTLGTGTLRLYPFYLPHSATLTQIGAEVTTIGDVGSKFRLGIYADTGGFQPGALVVDAGQIAGDSATVQSLTISQALQAGIYWTGGVVQSVTTNQPTIRTTGAASYSLPMSSTPGAGGAAAGYSHGSTVTGALPSTFTVGGLVGSIARVHLKA